MILDKILGYWVTDDPDVMDGFLSQARAYYAELEQALEPISVALADLETDWKPRPTDFWEQKLTDLTPIRRATKACLLLFERERTTPADPVPLVIAATALKYAFSLHYVNDKIEQAGILLTAYCNLISDSSEAGIRQRQRVLDALRQVDEEGRKAISKGRFQLDEAPDQQQKITEAYQPQQADPQEEQPATTKPRTKATRRHALRVVRSEDEEGGPQL